MQEQINMLNVVISQMAKGAAVDAQAMQQLQQQLAAEQARNAEFQKKLDDVDKQLAALKPAAAASEG